ncbi:MAG: hypothetical protein J6C51_01830 [Clostridia bacterium]|nr:hypothetical protein [Clostridia bacterium]
MKYILQIFTGGWNEPNYTAEKILERLKMLIPRMDVEKVILGWYPDESLYRPIGEYLRENGIDMVLWLPVFSELQDRVPMKAAVDIWGRALTKTVEQQGENFAFSCPTEPCNLQAAVDVYEMFFSRAGFSGVFLDRVRTQSFVGGVEGVLSCGCDSCRRAYLRHGVDLEKIARAYDLEGDRFFDADSESLQRFLNAKQQILTESVSEICRAFKARDLKVGLDVFAPLMSPFVGQSLSLLAEEADFIKPMLYRRTFAPAGIGYEYGLIKQCAPNAVGYPDIVTDTAFLKKELDALRSLPCAVYPGIEINRREDIAPTDPEYVRESLRTLFDSGIEGAVLSWDVMLAPDAHFPFSDRETDDVRAL